MADRVQTPATAVQKTKLAKLSPSQVNITELSGEQIDRVLDRAPGNDAPIDGIKAITASGWFAARPSGTEDIYKIYAESFRGEVHLHDLLCEAQTIVDGALADR
jgi:phosphoglucomutase